MKFRRMMGNAKLFWRKKGPDIMVVAGTLFMVGGAIVAAIKAPEVKEIIEGAEDNLNGIKEIHEHGNFVEKNDEGREVVVPYDDAAYRKDVVMCYAKTAGAIVKTMAIPIGMEAAGAFMNLRGHGMIRGQLTATAASLAAVTADRDRLMEKVKEKLGGKEADKLYYNAKTTKDEVVDENGKKSKVENIVIASAEDLGPYDFFFDEDVPGFVSSSAYNNKQLQDIQDYLNDRLQINGHLFVNEIYTEFKKKHVPSGQIDGYLYDGVEYFDKVDFGLDEPINERFRKLNEEVAIICLRPRTNIVNQI